ncbi:partial Putative HTH-type transcriptional regulator, partial [Planctomycetaceae bacterium]
MNAPTGTVTLVFTDIQDSTPLWERHGPRFEDCLKLHNEIMRSQIGAHGGYEVKTEGDAFMVAFARATDAARFAFAAQLALHAAPWPPEVGEVFVRMGLHTGEPIATPDTNGRMDYFGPAVNRAARVAGAGHGGQILLSEAAHSAAAEALADAFVRDLGEHRLKGLERSERIFQALPRALDQRKFVALQTLSALPTNLPPQTTSFVGRDKEIRDLVSMLRPRDAKPAPGMQSARTKLYSSGRFQQTKTVLEPAWLITLTGPGGTGKTRLALRVGNELLDAFEGGVWLADLTTARTISDVCIAVAAALGVPITGKEAPETVVANVLQYRKPLLLILDNFEQVVKHGNATIGLWHQAAPNVRFITTSRSILGIAGEREYEVQPLPTPAKKGTRRNTAHISSFDGITLFVQRATEADSRFALSDENAEAVAEICAEL